MYVGKALSWHHLTDVCCLFVVFPCDPWNGKLADKDLLFFLLYHVVKQCFIFCRSGNLTPATNYPALEALSKVWGCVWVLFLWFLSLFFFFNQTPHAYPNTEDVLQDALLESISVTFWLEGWYLVASYRESWKSEGKFYSVAIGTASCCPACNHLVICLFSPLLLGEISAGNH